MKKNLLKILTVLMLFLYLFSFSGCGLNLKDIGKDYILVDGHHTLLGESIDNKRISTYRITASITNTYIDLPNVKITLTVPDHIEVDDKEKWMLLLPATKEDETKDFSWEVKIPATYEDQNIEYTVTISSDIINPITSSELIFVEGLNENDNFLDHTKDIWSFKNYSKIPIPLLQEDYDALIYSVSDKESIDTINELIKTKSNGYCYGMAATAILAKNNRIDISRLDAEATDLYSLEKNNKVKSLIGYYWIAQFWSPVQEDLEVFAQLPTNEKLKIIEEKASDVKTGGSPFILSFFSQPNNKAGHAVVGYGHENGEFFQNGKSYDSRILIYDSNYPNGGDSVHFYYNKNTDEWYFPKYPKSSNIIQANSNINLMDVNNMESNYNSNNSYIDFQVYDNENFNVFSADGVLLAEVTEEQTESDYGFYNCPYIGSDNLRIKAPLREEKNFTEEAFVFTPTNGSTSLNISILYEDCYAKASAKNISSLLVSPEKVISIEDASSNYELYLSSSAVTIDLEGLSVSGKNTQKTTLSVAEDGFLLTGDNLKNIKLVASSIKVAQKTRFSTEENTVFITQEGNEICVKTDADDNDTYETTIANGKWINNWHPIYGERNIFDFWITWVICGVLLLVGAVVLIVGIKRRKKKNSATTNVYYEENKE